MYFFFFQAEDGIRDHCVTGVQTCALPIWTRRSAAPSAEAAFVSAWGKATGAETYPSRARADDWSGRGKVVIWPLRSEERRVGEESRSRGGGASGKKRR